MSIVLTNNYVKFVVNEKRYSSTCTSVTKHISPSIRNDLTNEQQMLVNVMVDMGFPADRAAVAVLKYDGNSKKVIVAKDMCE